MRTIRLILHEIWWYRCEEFIKWEKTNGINKKIKKNKKNWSGKSKTTTDYKQTIDMVKILILEYKISFFNIFDSILYNISISAA